MAAGLGIRVKAVNQRRAVRRPMEMMAGQEKVATAGGLLQN